MDDLDYSDDDYDVYGGAVWGQSLYTDGGEGSGSEEEDAYIEENRERSGAAVGGIDRDETEDPGVIVDALPSNSATGCCTGHAEESHETSSPTPATQDTEEDSDTKRLLARPSSLSGRIKRRDPYSKKVVHQPATQLRHKLLESANTAKSGTFNSGSIHGHSTPARCRGLKPKNLAAATRWDSSDAKSSQAMKKRPLAMALVKGFDDTCDVPPAVDETEVTSPTPASVANISPATNEDSTDRSQPNAMRGDAMPRGRMKSRRISGIVNKNKNLRPASTVGQGRLVPSKVKMHKRPVSIASLRMDHEVDVSSSLSSVSANARIAVRRDTPVEDKHGSTTSSATKRESEEKSDRHDDNVIWILFEDSANTLRTIRERANPRNREAREGEGGWFSYIMGTHWASCMSISKHAEVLDEDVENEFRWLQNMLNGEEEAVRNTPAGAAVKEFVKSSGFSDLKKENSCLNPFETHVALVIGGRRYDMTTHGLIVSNLTTSADLNRRLGKLRLCFRITTTQGVTERLYERLNTSASIQVHAFPGMVLGTLSVVSNVSTGVATRMMNWARGFLRGDEQPGTSQDAPGSDAGSSQPVEVYVKHHTCTSLTWHELFRENILSEPNAPEGMSWATASSRWQKAYLYLTPSVLVSRLRNMRHVPTHARKDLGLTNLVSIESLTTSAYEKYLHEYAR